MIKCVNTDQSDRTKSCALQCLDKLYLLNTLEMHNNNNNNNNNINDKEEADDDNDIKMNDNNNNIMSIEDTNTNFKLFKF